jgi:putative transposase
VRTEGLPAARASGLQSAGRCPITVRYQSVQAPREPLRARLRELAAIRASYGYRRRHILLRREGWPVNRKLIERLYREEGLTLKRKRPKRRRSAVRRERAVPATAINERWAMDFVHETLSNGRTVRVLTVLDVYSRECMALEAGVGFRGEDVGRILTMAGAKQGSLPDVISVDNGPEFASKALDRWTVGLTGIGCDWTSVGRENRRIIRSSRRSRGALGESASRNIGLST